MAVWDSAVITNKGLALQAKLTSGNTLALVRAVAGAGYVDPDELINQTSVTDIKQELYFETESYPEEGKCAVPVKLSNSGISNEYYAKQIGIMAYDPDEGEILYLIAQAKGANEGKGTCVPAESAVAGFAAEWTFYMQYGQADGVTVNVDPSNTVSLGEVKTLIAQVTAESLGLGNVDNTADADKSVAFATEAAEARKVTYPIGIRFNGGKEEGVDKWVYDGSVSKSINITPEKLGAAEADHTQDMEHGGTGATNGAEGLANLLAAGNTILSAFQYGDELPEPGNPGRIFFLKVPLEEEEEEVEVV